jgi:hypothetical protein
VGSVADLAGLNAATQKVVAREVGVTRREMGRWMREAVAWCGVGPAEAGTTSGAEAGGTLRKRG